MAEAYHSPIESEKSELHGINLWADLGVDIPIQNNRVMLPLSATARTYVFTIVCS